MKKIFQFLVIAVLALGFTACEDVPAPYSLFSEGATIVPKGDGTLNNPYNVTAVKKFIEAGENLDQPVYVKGIVYKIETIDLSYGSGTFYISEDGTEKSPSFYVYRCKSLGNQSFMSQDELKVGDEVVLYGKVMNYGGTYETAQGEAYIFSINGKSANATGEPEGDGTLANPFNVIAANNFVAAGEGLDKEVYIKGIVSSTKEISPTFGNATFYISDDGTTAATQFYIYRCKGLGNQKITSEDDVKVGDAVVIYGKLTNYNGTFETVQNAAYIYSINGGTSGGNTGGGSEAVATGDGTLANPFNSVAANAYIAAMAADVVSENDVYIKGKIASVEEAYSTQFGNASFTISDDGTSANGFKVWRALYLNNEKYQDGQTQIKVGDEVIVCGKVVNFKGNTPETAQGQAYLYSLVSSEGGNTGGEGGGSVDNPITNDYITVTAASFGLENGTAVPQLTLSDGTTLSFDGGGNTNAPKYYTAGTNIRMYPKNTMTVKASKKIAAIVINVDKYNGTICNASGDISANPGSVSTSEQVVTISSVNATSTVITNTSTTTSTPSQIRWISMTIYYVE